MRLELTQVAWHLMSFYKQTDDRLSRSQMTAGGLLTWGEVKLISFKLTVKNKHNIINLILTPNSFVWIKIDVVTQVSQQGYYGEK